MSKSQIIRTKEYPYHVIGRCRGKKFFPKPISDVWEIFNLELFRASRNNLRVHAFVLMGNHFHLLCHTPESNLDSHMKLILRNSARRIKNGPIWEPYRWSVIQSPMYYHQVYRYLYQNPLRVNLVDRVQDYPYSTLNDVPFPICTFLPLGFAGNEGHFRWLNELYDAEDLKLIRLGLKKPQFDINKKKIQRFYTLTKPPIEIA